MPLAWVATRFNDALPMLLDIEISLALISRSFYSQHSSKRIVGVLKHPGREYFALDVDILVLQVL